MKHSCEGIGVLASVGMKIEAWDCKGSWSWYLYASKGRERVRIDFCPFCGEKLKSKKVKGIIQPVALKIGPYEKIER